MHIISQTGGCKSDVQNYGRKFSEIRVTRWLPLHSDFTKFNSGLGSAPEPTVEAYDTLKHPSRLGGRDTPSPHTEQELNTKSSLLQMAEITATFPITSTCSKINKRSFQIRAILNAKQWVNTTWPNMNRLSTIHSQKQIQGEYSIQTYFNSLF